MRKALITLLVFLLLQTALSGCLIVPIGHGHHEHEEDEEHEPGRWISGATRRRCRRRRRVR